MKKTLLIAIGVLLPLPLLAEQNQTGCMVGYDASTGQTIVRTIGVGFEPRQTSLSPAQKRLLAKRAALVHGYRNLLRTANRFPTDRNRFPYYFESTSGFIRGVEIEQTRYFPNGRVEVELHLPLRGDVRSFRKVHRIFTEYSIPVYEVEEEKQYISKEEYEKLFRPKNVEREAK